MDPFDAPPSTPAVSFEPPVDPPAPRRGRTVAIVIGTAGLIGAGIVGVSQLASADDPGVDDAAGADRPELDLVAASEPADEEPADDEPADDEPADDSHGDDGAADGADGEIRIQIGDGEPIVIDLGDGDLGAVLGDVFDSEVGRELRECVGVPMLDLPAAGEDGDVPGGELGELDLGMLFDQFFADGALGELMDDEQLQAWLDEMAVMAEDLESELDDHDSDAFPGALGGWEPGDQVTVTGDDGLTVIDLGDGDASVTIERDGGTGEVTIATEGSATARELDELLGGLDLPALPEGGWPEGGWPMLDERELERIEECIADLAP